MLDAEGLPFLPVQYPGWPDEVDMSLYTTANSDGTMYPKHWTAEQRGAYLRAAEGGRDVAAAHHYAYQNATLPPLVELERDQLAAADRARKARQR